MSAFLISNLKRRARDVVVYDELAKQLGTSTVTKSAYFKAAILLEGTIIEGLVFYLIYRSAGNTKPLIISEPRYAVIHRFPEKVMKLLSDKNVLLCKEKPEEIYLGGNMCSFKLMTEYCRDKKLVTQKEYRQLKRIRDFRNRIHLQSLTGPDNGYTNGKLQYFLTVADMLLDKF